VRAERVLDGRARGAVAQRVVDARRMEREALADLAVVDRDPGVLADEVALRVGDVDVPVNRLEHALAGDRGLAAARVGERVAQVLRDVFERPDVEVRSRLLDCVDQTASGNGDVGHLGTHPLAFSNADLPARLPKTTHSSRLLPIMRFRPWVPPAISPQA